MSALAAVGTSASAVSVMVRTRPTPAPAKEINANRGEQTVGVLLPKPGIGIGLDGAHAGVHTTAECLFKFDGLLHNASQEAVYDHAARDIVESVLQGYNGTVMTYGQTGAGKTHTISGPALSYEDRGIIPRAIGHIFRAISDRPDLSFRVSVSFVEVYNEHLFDLLAVRPPASTRNPSVAHNVDLPIQEDAASGAISIKGLNKKLIVREQEALDALFQGDAARSIGEHALNEQSTRSHCIYTIYLETRSRIESSEKVLVSKLNLIDLAGSERVGKSQSTGVLLNEAKFINKSLSFLEQVVVALSNKNRDHIPYRSSRLTQLLKDSIGGNTRTRVICNIHADKANLEETVSTLKFGTRMRKISNRVAINIELDPLLHVAKLQKEVRELKHDLSMHDQLANRLGVTYDAYTPEEAAVLRKRLDQYVHGGPQAEEIEIVNLRQVREAFRQLKQIALDLAAKGGNGTSSRSSTQLLPGLTSPEPVEESHMVGDVDEDATAGFGLGMVAHDRRPVARPDSRDEPLKPKNILRSRARAAGQNVAAAVTSPLGSHARTASAGRRAVGSAAGGINLPPVVAAPRAHSSPKAGRRASFGIGLSGIATSSQEEKVNGLASPVSEAAAFEEFRSVGPGFDAAGLLTAARADSAMHRRELRDASIRVNDAKRRIDELSSLVASKKVERDSRGELTAELEVLDEDEYAAVQEAAAAKAEYKHLYAARAEVDQSLRIAESCVQQARQDLFDAFAAWYRERFGSSPSAAAAGAHADDAIQQAAESRFAAAQRAQLRDEGLDPEARSFQQATRNLHQAKARPMLNGGRRPYVGAAFK